MRLLIFISLIFVTGTLRAEPLIVGQKAPNWMLTNEDGKTIMLYQETEAGHQVVMLFWSSWCGRCEKVIPAIERLEQQSLGQPVKFYALNVWDDDSQRHSELMTKRKLNAPQNPLIKTLSASNSQSTPKPYTVKMHVLPRAGNVAKRFGVRNTPTVVVVGKDKHIQYFRVINNQQSQALKALKAIVTSP